eukprot:Awhi_evm1s1562
MTENYIKCGMCKSLKHINSDYIIVKERRLKTCNSCRDRQKVNREKNKCEHNKEKSRCKECGGSGICEHNKRRENCQDCKGSGICIHNKHKSQCKECGGSGICIHDKQKSHCKECGGSQICIHNKSKSECKDCMNLEQQIRYTLKQMIKTSKRADNRKEILDYNTFIDLSFLYVLLEDYPDMRCYYKSCNTIMEFNPDNKDDLITIERKENIIEGYMKMEGVPITEQSVRNVIFKNHLVAKLYMGEVLYSFNKCVSIPSGFKPRSPRPLSTFPPKPPPRPSPTILKFVKHMETNFSGCCSNLTRLKDYYNELYILNIPLFTFKNMLSLKIPPKKKRGLNLYFFGVKKIHKIIKKFTIRKPTKKKKQNTKKKKPTTPKNTFIPYGGNKRKEIDTINKYLPEKFNTFVDVFGGSGSVGISVKEVRNCTVVYNDYNKELFNVIKMLRSGGLNDEIREFNEKLIFFHPTKNGLKKHLDDLLNNSSTHMKTVIKSLFMFRSLYLTDGVTMWAYRPVKDK